jgi:hypothetical protein
MVESNLTPPRTRKIVKTTNRIVGRDSSYNNSTGRYEKKAKRKNRRSMREKIAKEVQRTQKESEKGRGAL